MRSLTLSKPWWSLSRIFCAPAKSFFTLERFFHGTLINVSMYERTTVASADIGDIILSLLSSADAFSFASSGIPDSSIRFLSASNSSGTSSSSPSSF